MSPTPVGGPPPNPGNSPGQQFDYSRYTGEAGQAVAQASYGMKDGSGGSDIFIPEIVGDFPRYEVKSVGMRVNDIIMGPAGNKHPFVVAGKIRPDDLVHTCWIYVHKDLSGGWKICPYRTYNKRCPACEERQRIMANSSLTDEQVKTAIKPYASGKHPLGLYNMVNHTMIQPQFQVTWQEPVMWWPITYAYMEAILQGKAKSDGAMEGTGYINYFWPTAGPQGGRHIKYDVIQDGQYFKYAGHTFYQRQAPVPPHILQQARPLSDFLYIGADWDSFYDEIKQAVDVVVEGSHQGQAGAGQPTGQGMYTGPGTPEFGGVQTGPVFGTPPPQLGRFPECSPTGVLGMKYAGFNECLDCPLTIKVHCFNSAPGEQQAKMPIGTPECAPAPALGQGGYEGQQGPVPPTPGPALAPPPPPAGGPVPRRNVT